MDWFFIKDSALTLTLNILFSSVTLNPTIRYTIWSMLLATTFSNIGYYTCVQTQAQRYMCVKDTKSAQKYFID